MAILGRFRVDARATPLPSREAQSGPPSQSSVIEVTVVMDSFWKTYAQHCEATISMCRFSWELSADVGSENVPQR